MGSFITTDRDAWERDRLKVSGTWPIALVILDLRFWDDPIACRNRKRPSARTLAACWGWSASRANRFIRQRERWEDLHLNGWDSGGAVVVQQRDSGGAVDSGETPETAGQRDSGGAVVVQQRDSGGADPKGDTRAITLHPPPSPSTAEEGAPDGATIHEMAALLLQTMPLPLTPRAEPPAAPSAASSPSTSGAPIWLQKLRLSPEVPPLAFGAMAVRVCSAITGRVRTLDGYSSGIQTDTKRSLWPLWKEVGKPADALLERFEQDLLQIAAAARDCSDPLFAHDIRAENWGPGGKDRSGSVATLCVQSRFDERRAAAQQHASGSCCCRRIEPQQALPAPRLVAPDPESEAEKLRLLAELDGGGQDWEQRVADAHEQRAAAAATRRAAEREQSRRALQEARRRRERDCG